MLFVGVFDTTRYSTNTSQLLSFKRAGHNVTGYNYRKRASLVGNKARDELLLSTIAQSRYDLVVFSKCNQVECSQKPERFLLRVFGLWIRWLHMTTK